MDMPDLGENTPYRVIRLLGKGSIADVFLAEERSTGGKVVLKVLRMPLSQTELETFLQHVQALSRVLHPHLLRILNYGSTAQKPFLVTEYAPQGSLRQRILPGTRLTPDLVLSYVKQVADALHHLHQQHMLHLNLKPGNLLLGQSGAILLSDAGLLAALPGAHTQFSADLAGSASYLAPEQIQGTATEASDQYALGCMVYEWLSGTPPFSGSFAEVVKQQLFTQPPLLRTRVPELSPLFEQIVAIALAKNPADRFATIQALARAFENACYDTAASPAAGTSASNSSPLAQQAASSESAQHIAADKEDTRLIRPAASSKVVEQGADDQGTAQSGQQPAVSQRPSVPVQQAVSGKISMLFICPGCGRPTPHSARTSCPACGYPLDPAQERAMLDTVLRDLQPLAYTGGAFLPIASLAQLSDVSMTALRRVANNGGAHVSVSWLIQHYQNRMQALRAQRTAPTALAPGASSLKSPGAPATQTAARQRNASASKQPQAASTPAAANLTQQQPSASAPTSHPGFIPAPPSERPLPLPRVPRPGPVTALRPLIESPAGLMVALGTFLLLIAILVLPFAFPGEPLSLLITFGAQVFFAFMTVATHRSARFREFAGIYAGFFALTVPLLALDAFQSDLTTDIPLLIGLAALYATITYGAFAVTQRFSPFSVLSLTALFVADITLMPAITGSQQWTAGSLLCLALLLLPALSRHEHAPHLPLERLFETSWDVLRRACATFSWLVAGATACLYIPLTISSILSSLSYSTQSSVDFVQEAFGRLPLLVTMTLLTLWLVFAIKRRQWSFGQYILPFLLLVLVLLVCYAFILPLFSSTVILPFFGSTVAAARFIYAVALLGMALFYDSVDRFATASLHLYLRSGSYLNTMTLLLIGILPFLLAPVVPLRVFQPGPLLSQIDLSGLLDAALLGGACWFSVFIALRRAGEVGVMGGQAAARNFWPWLLLLSGLLFTWGYATAGLAFGWLGVSPFWWFEGLTLLFVLAALLVRPRFGPRWSSVLDVLVLSEAVLTLWLGLGRQSNAPVSLALLVFGTLFYCILLFQRRSLWLFIPCLFVLADLPNLFLHAHGVVLLLGLLLPFAATAVRRIMPPPRVDYPVGSVHDEQLNTTWQWDWPLLAVALLCGTFILIHDLAQPTGVPIPWLNRALPTAGEFASFALTWYVVAGLVRAKWWLIPVGIFALATLALLDKSFWTLTTITVGSALLGVVLSRLVGRTWALPCYIMALVSSLLVMGIGFAPDLLPLTAWTLLGFAALVALVSIVDALPEVLWLLPIFTSASVIASFQLIVQAHHLEDFAHLPAIALLSAGMGALLSRLSRHKPALATPRDRLRLFHVLAPCYAAALIAALLTGFSFFVPDLQPVRPFVVSLLFAYALATFLILLLEHFPAGHWLVSGFGLWGIILSIQSFPNVLPFIGLGVFVSALLADLLVKQSPYSSLPAAWHTLVRPSWGWAWTLLAAATWVSAGFFPPAALTMLSPNAAVASLLIAAFLLYLTGVILRQGLFCLITPLLAVWPLWMLTHQGDFFALFVIFCLGTLLAVGIDRLIRVQRSSQAARQKLALIYALPFFVSAALAAGLTGVAGSGFTSPALRGYAGGLLLLYSLGCWCSLLLTRQPRFNLLTAAFGVWGLELMVQTPVYTLFGWRVSTDLIVTALGLSAAVIGLCTVHRAMPAPAGGKMNRQFSSQDER